LQLIAASSDNYMTSLNQANINVVIRQANEMLPSDIHLIIAADILSNQKCDVLKDVTRTLEPGCFILLEESNASMIHLRIAYDIDLMLIARQTTSIGKTYLLLRKKKDKAERITVHITEKNLSWLDNVKAALKESDRKGHEVLLVSQGEELFGTITSKSFLIIPSLYNLINFNQVNISFIGLVGLANCIRHETGGANIRYVFIQDKTAPMFHESMQFYADQLNKGLRANILKEGHWGSYRHLQFKHSNTRTEYAYVNALRKGNLNSLTWIQSRSEGLSTPLNTTQCKVYYAPINNR